MPQFESISSPALSLLYGPTLISVHGYWENRSFDYMNSTFVSKVMSLLFNMLKGPRQNAGSYLNTQLTLLDLEDIFSSVQSLSRI